MFANSFIPTVLLIYDSINNYQCNIVLYAFPLCLHEIPWTSMDPIEYGFRISKLANTSAYIDCCIELRMIAFQGDEPNRI